VLQCVAVCCSVLQCVAMCCSVSLSRCESSSIGCSDEIPLKDICIAVLQCVAVCCSVLQCVAVCCSVLQCVAIHEWSGEGLKFEVET